MKINILRYIMVLVLEVPGGPNKSLAGLWPVEGYRRCTALCL